MTAPVSPRPGAEVRSRAGRAWLALIFVPPVLVVAGLVAMFVWQGSKGGVTPKWRKAPATNAAPASFR